MQNEVYPSKSSPQSFQHPDHLVLLRGGGVDTDDESPMAAVTLPARPPVIRTQPTTSLPLPPRAAPRPQPPARPPSRTSSPPVPPPRPESTLTSRSLKLSPSSSSGPGRGSSSTAPAPPPPCVVSLPSVLRVPSPVPSMDAASVMAAANSISLAIPRPPPERVQNLYVDAPLKSGELLKSHSVRTPGHQKKSLASVHNGRNRSKNDRVTPTTSVLCDKKGGGDSSSSLISPSTPSTLQRSLVSTTLPSKQIDSIICIQCGKCKCNACQKPHQLPEYWMCGGNVKCSKDTVVDCLSCMCCVKALFYHCGKNWDETVEDSTNVSEKPCSCSTNYTCARWTCMGIMSFLMPCLLCYLPLRGCTKASQAVYERCTASGCRCGPESNRVVTSEPTSSPSTSSKSMATDNLSILSSPPSSPLDSKKRLLE